MEFTKLFYQSYDDVGVSIHRIYQEGVWKMVEYNHVGERLRNTRVYTNKNGDEYFKSDGVKYYLKDFKVESL